MGFGVWRSRIGVRDLLLSTVGLAVVDAAAAQAADVAGVVGSTAEAFEAALFLQRQPGVGEVIYAPDTSPANIASLFTADDGRLAAAAGGEAIDRALFYYSGEGARGDDGRAYLVGDGGSGRTPLDDVLAGMAALNAGDAVVVLETSLGGAAIAPPANVTVVLASDGSATAERDPATGLGFFTVALIHGATTVADVNGDGVVTVAEGADFAALALAQRDGAAQTPGIIGDDSARLFLATSRPWVFESGEIDRAWLERAGELWSAQPSEPRALRLQPGVATAVAPVAAEIVTPAEADDAAAEDVAAATTETVESAAAEPEPTELEEAVAATVTAEVGAEATEPPVAEAPPVEDASTELAAADVVEPQPAAEEPAAPAEPVVVAQAPPPQFETPTGSTAPRSTSARSSGSAGGVTLGVGAAALGGLALAGGGGGGGSSSPSPTFPPPSSPPPPPVVPPPPPPPPVVPPPPPPPVVPPPPPPPPVVPPPPPPPPVVPPPPPPPPVPPAGPGTPGNDTFTLNTTIAAPVELLGGEDLVVLQSGGSVGAGAFVDGGANNDALQLAVTTFDLGQLGPAAAFRSFESLDVGQAGGPVTLTGTGAINQVTGGAGNDVLTLAGSLTGDIDLGGGIDQLQLSGAVFGSVNLGGGDDSLAVDDSFALASADIDAGPGTDLLALTNGAPLTLSLANNSVGGFEVLEKRGAGVLDLSTANNGAGLREIDVFDGVVNFTGEFAGGGNGGGDADVYGGTLNLVGNFEFAPINGSTDVAPVEVMGGVLSADGALQFEASSAVYSRPEAVYVAGGTLAPGGIGTVGDIDIVAQNGFGGGILTAVPVLSFLPGTVHVDWAANDDADTIDVSHNGALVAAATTVGALVVAVNPLAPGAIADGDSAVLITSDTFRYGSGGSTNPADAAVSFTGVPADVVASFSFQPEGGRETFSISFASAGGGMGGMSLAPTPTPGTMQATSLLSTDLSGGALDMVGGTSASSMGSVSFASSWVDLGHGAAAGVARGSFLTQAPGAPAYGVSNAARSFAARPVLAGALTVGFGSGFEQTLVELDHSGLRQTSFSRTETGYVSAFVGGDAGAWRLAAAVDVGALSYVVSAVDVTQRLDTDGMRLRAELQAARDFDVAGAPLALKLGLRRTVIETDAFRRDDGLWTAGPAARFTAALVDVSSPKVFSGAFAGVTPYARFTMPVSGRSESARALGVRIGEAGRLSFDLAVEETTLLQTRSESARLQLNWRF